MLYIYDEGQSFCNVIYGKLKVHCKDSVHSLHEKKSRVSTQRTAQIEGVISKMLKLHGENQTLLVHHHACK